MSKLQNLFKNNKLFKYSLIGFISVIVFLALSLAFAWVGLVAVLTKPHFQNPVIAHHHFRLQVFVDGKKVDFSQDDFQEAYNQNICSGGLTETPIHFHDKDDQLVHIHWANITGGEVLKNYGLDRINGIGGYFGFRADQQFLGVFPKSIPTLKHDRGIEGIPDNGEGIWLYTGVPEEYSQRQAEDFLSQDLETFFGKKSQITIQREESEALEEELNKLIFIRKALARAGHGEDADKENTNTELASENIQTSSNNSATLGSDSHSDMNMQDMEGLTQAELEEINDLLGNVVIFVQDEEPEPERVTEAFNNLNPLKPSSCGG